MVEIAEIKDEDSLRGWLEGQSQEVSVWMARRAALRVLPVYWRWVAESQTAGKRDLTALPVLRFNLTSEVARTMPAPGIVRTIPTSTTESAALAAHRAANAAVRAADAAVRADAAYAADAAAAAALVALRTAADAIAADAAAAADAAVRAAGVTAGAAIWRCIGRDCRAVDGADAVQMAGSSLEALPLWHEAENPILPEWSAWKTALRRPEQELDWSFWIAWYDSVLEGKPLNADMLAEIAQINNADWGKGEAVVLPRIHDIWQRYQLKAQISELEKKLQEVAKVAEASARPAQRPAQMGDNQGPPLDDMPAAPAPEVTIIWEPLQAIKQQVEAEQPDEEVVRENAEKLKQIAIQIAKYIGGKADTFLEGFASESGKALGKALGVAVAAAAVAGVVAWYNAAAVEETPTLADDLLQFADDALKWANALPK